MEPPHPNSYTLSLHDALPISFYDNYFQTLGAQKTVSHQTSTQRPPHPRTIVTTHYTYHTEDCVYYISFYKGDVFWTNISISIRAAADNRLR